MGLFLRSTVIVCLLLAVACVSGFAQSATSASDSSSPVQPSASTAASANSGDYGTIGAGVKVSLLGVGGEVAVRVTQRSNVRAGFDMMNYSRAFHKDGIAYAGQLNFKTFEAHYDIFPWAKGFHISPGVLFYAAAPITATASVPGTQSFSLGGVTYYSDPTNPIAGSGKIKFNQAAPMVTFGWGNLISRKEEHRFTVPFEMGVAFQGSPKATLALAGNVCDSPGINCRNAATDPTVRSNVISEQNKINNTMSFFKRIRSSRWASDTSFRLEDNSVPGSDQSVHRPGFSPLLIKRSRQCSA